MRRRFALGPGFAQRYGLALAVVMVLVIVTIAGVNVLIDQKLASVSRVHLTLASSPSGGANYLLVGSDTRAFVTNSKDRQSFGSQSGNNGQRSDTIMVLHAEPTAGRSLLVSVPRDLWVHIPGQGMSKINAAFTAGPQKLVDTLQSALGIPIQHYVDVNFDTFRKLVNSIGTVPVLFPAPARDAMSGLNIPTAGCWQLDGPGALAFVRSRDMQVFDATTQKWRLVDAIPDIGRVGRQQAFLRELSSIALNRALSNPLNANSMVDSVTSDLRLDDGFAKGDLFTLLDAFRTVSPNDPNRVQTTTLPWKLGPTQQGQDVLYLRQPDADQILARLRDFGGGATNPPSSGSTSSPNGVRVRVLNASGVSGAAARTLAALERVGFSGAGTGNDARGRITTSEIRYRSGSEPAARKLAGYVPSARLIVDSTVSGADAVLVVGRSFSGVTSATRYIAPLPSGRTAAATQPASLAPVPGC